MGRIFKIGLGVWDVSGVWLQLTIQLSIKIRSVCNSGVEIGYMFQETPLNHIELKKGLLLTITDKGLGLFVKQGHFMWIFAAVKASPVSFKTYLSTIIINPFVFMYLGRILLFSIKRLDNE